MYICHTQISLLLKNTSIGAFIGPSGGLSRGTQSAWEWVNFLHSRLYGAVGFGCVTKPVLETHQNFDYCWAVLAQHKGFLFLAPPAVNTPEVGKRLEREFPSYSFSFCLHSNTSVPQVCEYLTTRLASTQRLARGVTNLKEIQPTQMDLSSPKCTLLLRSQGNQPKWKTTEATLLPKKS